MSTSKYTVPDFFDYSKIQKEKLCSLANYKKVLKEVQDVNDDFKTLRTRIEAVPDYLGIFHFLLYPSDGAIADKPICGRIFITSDYPQGPPIVHVLTMTNRYNVDIFNSSAYTLSTLHSSSCFDILKAGYAGSENSGSWKKDYTISALIASLLQSIVTINVPQQYGPEIQEFVTMEKLKKIHLEVDKTYNRYSRLMPEGLIIDGILSNKVITEQFIFKENQFISNTNNADNADSVIVSDPVTITSKKVLSIGLDLSKLQKNVNTVFSIVLTTNPKDLVGKIKDTILFRNGVTGTAAAKKGPKTNWFYHGRPLNQENLKVVVTLGHEEFTISYSVNDEPYVIHGDLPVAFLTKKDIENLRPGLKFYLCLLLKNKGGQQVSVNLFKPECGLISKPVSVVPVSVVPVSVVPVSVVPVSVVPVSVVLSVSVVEEDGFVVV